MNREIEPREAAKLLRKAGWKNVQIGGNAVIGDKSPFAVAANFHGKTITFWEFVNVMSEEEVHVKPDQLRGLVPTIPEVRRKVG